MSVCVTVRKKLVWKRALLMMLSDEAAGWLV
jgi:hypothetical protein